MADRLITMFHHSMLVLMIVVVVLSDRTLVACAVSRDGRLLPGYIKRVHGDMFECERLLAD